MASQALTLLALALALALSMQGTLGNIECENLDKDSCAYAVSSTGKRCVLEKHVVTDLFPQQRPCGLSSFNRPLRLAKSASPKCFVCEEVWRKIGCKAQLRDNVLRSGAEKYACGTSEIEGDKVKDRVETDECIKACGLDRTTIGISSDSLLEPHFARKLCSKECYGNCPNIVDLYFNLAAGEGVYLPKLCEAQGANVRREMTEIKSSGYVTPAPESPQYVNGVNFLYAPSMAPF